MDDAKRHRILDAAQSIFSTLGFKKASISDIAEAAGVAKGTVYLACDSKSELFFQSVMRNVQQFVSAMALAADPNKPADQLLEDLSLKSLEFFEKHPLVRDLFVGIHHLDHPDCVDRFEMLRSLGRSHIAEVLRLGIRQGRFRDDLDLDETAQILQDLQNAALMAQSRGMYRQGHDSEARLRRAIRLVFAGLRASGANLTH